MNTDFEKQYAAYNEELRKSLNPQGTVTLDQALAAFAKAYQEVYKAKEGKEISFVEALKKIDPILLDEALFGRRKQ